MENQILVIGGTGTIGQSLVQLLEKGKANFKVLTRTEEKAAPLKDAGIPTVMGSLGEWPNIEKILSDVDTVFLLTSPSPEQVDLQNGLIDRAKKAGVSKIVKLSAVVAAHGPDVQPTPVARCHRSASSRQWHGVCHIAASFLYAERINEPGHDQGTRCYIRIHWRRQNPYG